MVTTEGGDGAGSKYCACGGPVKEEAIGVFVADADKEFGVFEGVFDGFTELVDLF